MYSRYLLQIADTTLLVFKMKCVLTVIAVEKHQEDCVCCLNAQKNNNVISVSGEGSN